MGCPSFWTAYLRDVNVNDVFKPRKRMIEKGFIAEIGMLFLVHIRLNGLNQNNYFFVEYFTSFMQTIDG